MALPIDFITRTRVLLGKEFDSLEAALQTDAPVSVRIHKKRLTPLPHSSAAKWQIPWCKTGYYLPERLTYTFDPLFHAGGYYVQEASSMFLEQVIEQYVTTPVRCLDLCAAPGGKSTHLLSLLPEGSLLVSNEVIRTRSHVLAENIIKWGDPNCIVINNDPEEIGQLTHLFDIIVTDVPCSGEGMFRKDTDSTGEWSVANVELCAARQRRIIHDIWNALKPGGLLVYSTCTYNTEENEENIHYIQEELGAEVLPIATHESWQITGALKYNHPVYRFFPHKTKGEGFFLALLRKAEGEIKTLRPNCKSKKEKGKAASAIPEIAKRFTYEKEGNTLSWDGNKLILRPESVSKIYPFFQDRFHILSAGVPIGELKGKDLVPTQQLAQCLILNSGTFPSVELSLEEAIKYLKKETLVLPDRIEKGYVVARYNGFPLGFVKNLGNRANNLYPQERRIRTSYTPEKITVYRC